MSEEGSRERERKNALRTKTMRLRNPMNEGLSTLSRERVDVRGCEWMGKMCLYWSTLRFSLVSLPTVPLSLDTFGASNRLVVEEEVLPGMEVAVEVAEREAVAIASVVFLGAR